MDWLKETSFQDRIAFVAALVAVSAAGATFWQASISRDTEYRQLRSYLYVSPGQLETSDGVAKVKVAVKHSGATPAYKVRIDAVALVGKYLLNDEDLGDPITTGGSQQKQVAILNGNDTSELIVSQGNKEALALLSNPRNEHALYVHGVVRYLDVFGVDNLQPERRYEFCFVYRLRAGPLGSEAGCEKYNKPG